MKQTRDQNSGQHAASELTQEQIEFATMLGKRLAVLWQKETLASTDPRDAAVAHCGKDST
jgi:hypothetical protein